ncbi:hypothetical protein NW067_01775 [Mycoplasmopsis cynos]|nr:hypothetical protein [Mycoplasmopsis cynos]UWV83006.1 hypothetical protein NW067_01775 [Mycoplasmopsis cynos]
MFILIVKTFLIHKVKSLVERINFALSDYDLELLSTKTYSDVKDNSSFLYAMIGSLIAFSLLDFYKFLIMDF